MNSPFISREAMSNRREITAIFRESGFVAYPYEFWHYSSGDAYQQLLLDTGKPARYGAVDFDQTTGCITPYKNHASISIRCKRFRLKFRRRWYGFVIRELQ